MKPFYQDWKIIDETNNHIIKEKNQDIKNPEFYNSLLVLQNSNMRFKIINGDLVILKVSAIMGNYSLVQFGNTEIAVSTQQILTDHGVTLRGRNVKGKIDQFGREYVYSTNEFIEKKGKRFARVRKTINNYPNYKIERGYSPNIDFVVKEWSKHNKSKHQLKLLEIIKKNLDLVDIFTLYNNNHIIGFSVMEAVNKKNLIGVQRLINPSMKLIIREPNTLLHYQDCLDHPNMLLNIGASRNKKIDIAKQKLRPIDKIKIYRKVSVTNITKEIFNGINR